MLYIVITSRDVPVEQRPVYWRKRFVVYNIPNQRRWTWEFKKIYNSTLCIPYCSSWANNTKYIWIQKNLLAFACVSTHTYMHILKEHRKENVILRWMFSLQVTLKFYMNIYCKRGCYYNPILRYYIIHTYGFWPSYILIREFQNCLQALASIHF